MAKLNSVDLWMVEQQLDYVKIHGIVQVLQNLRNQGYFKVADEVERRYNKG